MSCEPYRLMWTLLSLLLRHPKPAAPKPASPASLPLSLPSPATPHSLDVDGSSILAALAGSRFGECLLELSMPGGGWGLAAAFSPDGSSLAVASQGPDGSHLTILTGIDVAAPSSLDAAGFGTEAAGNGAPVRLQHLPLPSLPLKCLAFLSDSVLAGGGFDCQPQLFARQADGRWHFVRSLAGEGVQQASCSSR